MTWGRAIRLMKPQVLREGESTPDPELVLKIALRVLAKNDRYRLYDLLFEEYSKK